MQGVCEEDCYGIAILCELCDFGLYVVLNAHGFSVQSFQFSVGQCFIDLTGCAAWIGLYVLGTEYMIRTGVWIVKGILGGGRRTGECGLIRAAGSRFWILAWDMGASRRPTPIRRANAVPCGAVASVIPVLRNVALLIGKKVSFALDFVVWIGFLLSWASAITQLNRNLWWAEMLLWGGLALIVFMLVRMVLRVVRP